MRIVSRRRLREFWERHADPEGPLKTWYAVARQASWSSLVEVRRTYVSADAAGEFTVFNVKGNAYRHIVRIEYEFQTIYVSQVLTHAEYDKGKWK